MKLDSLEPLLVEELRDIYNAETQLVKALPKMAKAAGSPELKQAFEEHLEQTREQVETEVNRWGFSVIHDMCGHGVGRALHEQPSVPNFFSPFTAGVLSEGLVIALEPIICESPTAVYEDEDGWTIRTENGCLAAHYEHTIVITRGGPILVTVA